MTHKEGAYEIAKAKILIREYLEQHFLPAYKLTARTIDFTDLARAKVIFVFVHGWKPNGHWSAMQELAKENGFRIQAK